MSSRCQSYTTLPRPEHAGEMFDELNAVPFAKSQPQIIYGTRDGISQVPKIILLNLLPQFSFHFVLLRPHPVHWVGRILRQPNFHLHILVDRIFLASDIHHKLKPNLELLVTEATGQKRLCLGVPSH